MVRVSPLLQPINKVLDYYGIDSSRLAVVDSTFEWCKKNGVPETNSIRAAKCFANADECFIVMTDCQTDTMINQAILHMDLFGFADQVERLNDQRLYLLHLVLHEIACFVLQKTDQHSRDLWAFREMPKHEHLFLNT